MQTLAAKLFGDWKSPASFKEVVRPHRKVPPLNQVIETPDKQIQNKKEDVTFNEVVPASIRLPNLLTIGAVDTAGDETAFTSYGPTVVVHRNGYEVDSYIPGGDR